jgi:transposase, IS5 family
MKQATFASVAYDSKKKRTRREIFLSEMDTVIPWSGLLALIEPHYAESPIGRHRIPLERMLRIYFMQQWFNLSDPATEDALYDSESMRRFAGIELGDDAVPDETTLVRFRHLLEQHGLTEAMFAEVRSLLESRKLLLKSGTIVDATLISAPASTKNARKSRDPEMKQTRKGKQYYFGMKVHAGTDTRGITHSLAFSHAAVGDITMLPELLHGEEQELYGDRAYWSDVHRAFAKDAGIRYRVNRRAKPGRPLNGYQRELNRQRSATRACGEHSFRVVKHLWGFTKTRYRGIAKNAARAFTMFALANLYLLRHQLHPPGHPCA